MSRIDNILTECHGWLFRGQSDSSWGLETSLERAARRNEIPIKEFEWKVVREFMRFGYAYLKRIPDVKETVEWLSIMQHHGAPTRFLDFTRSPWIALFFALEEAEGDCALWAVNPDSLACKDGIDFNVKLHDLIFEGAVPEHKIYENVPFFTHERLMLQQGTFLFSLNVESPFQSIFKDNNKEYRKYIFPKAIRKQLRKKLNEMNCNSHVLFPGIDGYAYYFRNPDI